MRNNFFRVRIKPDPLCYVVRIPRTILHNANKLRNDIIHEETIANDSVTTAFKLVVVYNTTITVIITALRGISSARILYLYHSYCVHEIHRCYTIVDTRRRLHNVIEREMIFEVITRNRNPNRLHVYAVPLGVLAFFFSVRAVGGSMRETHDFIRALYATIFCG